MFKKTALTTIAFFCIATLSLAATPPPISQDKASARNTANEMGSTADSHFKGGFQENVAAPMTANNGASSQMSTVSGVDFQGDVARGDATMTEKASFDFLTVLVQPVPTGDLGSVEMWLDTDMDGVKDYHYKSPNVSGICANGIISCEPGSWINCSNYKWDMFSQDGGFLTRVGITDLAGCYCINSSCGSNLTWNNMDLLLRDLGGGIAAQVQQTRPQFTVTEVEIDGPSINYFGNDPSSSVSSNSGLTGSDKTTQQLSNYAENGSALESAGEQYAYNQTSGPCSRDNDGKLIDPSCRDSHYSLITNSDAYKETDSEIKSCTIRKALKIKALTMNDIISSEGGTGKVTSCGTNCLKVTLGKASSSNYWTGSCKIYEHNYKLKINYPELVTSARMVEAKWDDYIQVWIGGTQVWWGPDVAKNFPPETKGVSCERSTMWHRNPNKDVTKYFQQKGIVETKVRVSVTGTGQGYAHVNVYVKEMCDSELETVGEASCQALDNDQNCRLRSEIIDGVVTYDNSNPTGLNPLPSTKTVADGSCSASETLDWWEKTRTYVCLTDHEYDFDEFGQRAANVKDTLDDSSGDYNDITKNSDGTWSPSSGSVQIDGGSSDTCKNICKTKSPLQRTGTNIAGSTGDYQTNVESWETHYRECTENGTKCPTELPGEQVVTGCGCQTSFEEATAVLSVMNEAGKDLICSDGQKK